MRIRSKTPAERHERLKAELRIRGTSLAQIGRDLEVLGLEVRRKSGRHGIQLMKLRYHSEELARRFERHGSEDMLLRVDPEDLGHISCWMDDAWHVVACTRTDMRGVPVESWKRAVLEAYQSNRSAARSGQLLVDDAVLGLREIDDAARARRRLGPINLSADELERAERNLFLGVRFDDGRDGETDPLRILAALAKLKKAYHTERPYFSTDIGDFYTWLKEELEEPKLKEMRHVVRSFITENYPLRPGAEILGEKVHKGKRMTFADARQVSGIARARMATTLGHLRPGGQEAKAAVTDVSVDDIKAVDAFWNKHSNLKDAAERLGLHPAQVKAFIDAGLLEAIRLNSALRYVTNASIDAILAVFSSAPADHPNSELLPIAEFSQSRCISMARVVSAALEGKIKDVRRNPDLSGIRSLLIDNGQLPIRQRRRHTMDMSVAEAAEHLQIGAMGVRALRDAGYLVQVHRRNPDTNHQRAFITFESIRRFEAECETLGQMATRIGIRPMHLAKRLDNAGVDPVATAGRTVRAYLRAALPEYLGSASPRTEQKKTYAT